MRKEYELSGSKPNPYAKRITARGREVLVQRYLRAENLVRLDEDVARAFPDEARVNEALRLLVRLLALAPVRKTKSTRSARSAKAGSGRVA